MNMAFPPKIADAAHRLKHAAVELNEAFAPRRSAFPDSVTPAQLAEAADQFMALMARIDQEEGETGPIFKDDVSKLGEYGLTVLMDLATWATQLDLDEPRRALEQAAIAAAYWIMRHDGEIRALEPVVNALANYANRSHNPVELSALAAFMGRAAQAAPAVVRQDMEKANPARAWRLLHLNRGIVATRSHNPLLMEQVFDELVRQLPDDAPAFFAEGMQQMEALGYPPPVQQVLRRYFDRWTRPTLH